MIGRGVTIRTFLIVIALLVTGCKDPSPTDETGSSLVEIFYLDIGIQTTVPVTRENVGEMRLRHGVVLSDSDMLRRLVALVERGGSCNFDEPWVRAKIVMSSTRVIHIDNDDCADDGGTLHQLDKQELKQVAAILHQLTQPAVP